MVKFVLYGQYWLFDAAAVGAEEFSSLFPLIRQGFIEWGLVFPIQFIHLCSVGNE